MLMRSRACPEVNDRKRLGLWVNTECFILCLLSCLEHLILVFPAPLFLLFLTELMHAPAAA